MRCVVCKRSIVDEMWSVCSVCRVVAHQDCSIAYHRRLRQSYAGSRRTLQPAASYNTSRTNSLLARTQLFPRATLPLPRPYGPRPMFNGSELFFTNTPASQRQPSMALPHFIPTFSGASTDHENSRRYLSSQDSPSMRSNAIITASASKTSTSRPRKQPVKDYLPMREMGEGTSEENISTPAKITRLDAVASSLVQLSKKPIQIPNRELQESGKMEVEPTTQELAYPQSLIIDFSQICSSRKQGRANPVVEPMIPSREAGNYTSKGNISPARIRREKRSFVAAALKKRALAENGSLTEEIDLPGKILKVSLLDEAPPGSEPFNIDLLQNCNTTDNALRVLLRITDSLQLKREDFPAIIKSLTVHFNHHNESLVKVKILSLFCTLGEMPEADKDLVIEHVMKLIEKASSHKVIAQGLLTVLNLSKALPSTNVTLAKIVNVAKHFLMDTNHYVKRICFQLIGSINVGNTTGIIADYIHSQDCRVRCAAMETLVAMHENGDKIDVSHYSDVCAALNDDYEIVREVALKIVCLIGNSYPENEVKFPESDKKIRLIDDAFLKVCQAVNDLSIGVRLIAMKLLATMTGVSMTFLTQTLDNKFKSDMRKKKSLHERSCKIVLSEVSTVKKGADDAPKELLHKDEVSDVLSGSCGALVQGLEDEFMEVRSASVDALRTLAIAHPEFAVLALDFLVDMFNDEIEAVRIKAIDSLTVMSHHILLREHQLETILRALKDVSIDVREGLHRMLAACVLSTKDCLQMCIDKLLDNLKKYPQDKKSIWKCCKEIGKKHSDLTLPLVPRLLDIHPFFVTPEPDVEDTRYISLLILIFNAAQNCPTMLKLFEERTIKHYSYLRVTLPSLVPHLTLPESVDFVEPVSTDAGAHLFCRLVNNLSKTRPDMNQSVLPQLEKLAKIDPRIHGPAQFITMFISYQVLVDKISKYRLWCSNAATKIQGNAIKSNLTELLLLCLKLQHLFMGLEKEELAAAIQFHLQALALHLVFITKVTNLSALALCDHFIKKADQTRKFLHTNNIIPNEFVKAVLSLKNTLEDTRPGVVARCLQPLLAKVSMVQPPKPNLKIRMCHAILNGPSTSADAPLKFTAGLVLAVQLDAEIFGLKDPLALRVRVHYPDNQTHSCVPAASHLRPLSDEGDYRLMTQAFISHSTWSEACYVEISLCIELSEEDMNHRAHYGIDPYLELCKPLKLYVIPEPIKTCT